jgi:type II secretory pathway component PulF
MDGLSLSIALIVVIAALLYYYATRNYGYWKERGVTFIQPLPLVGSMFKLVTLQEHIGTFFYKVVRKFKGREKFVGYFQVTIWIPA